VSAIFPVKQNCLPERHHSPGSYFPFEKNRDLSGMVKQTSLQTGACLFPRRKTKPFLIAPFPIFNSKPPTGPLRKHFLRARFLLPPDPMTFFFVHGCLECPFDVPPPPLGSPWPLGPPHVILFRSGSFKWGPCRLLRSDYLLFILGCAVLVKGRPRIAPRIWTPFTSVFEQLCTIGTPPRARLPCCIDLSDRCPFYPAANFLACEVPDL